MTDRETLTERLERLRPYWDSTRFALTESDVRWDYETGRHRYAIRPEHHACACLSDASLTFRGLFG